MTTHWTDRLSEFHDGELSPADHAACEEHLAACEGCRQLLSELRAVAASARADADRVPETDLWPGILARIGTPVERGPAGRAEPWHGSRRRQIVFSVPQLALAASLLIAVSAGVSYVAAGRARGGATSTESPIQAMAEPMIAASAEVVPANFADEQFDRAVADLEQMLHAQRDDLDPRTVVVIERNLAVIDEAIRQARAALDADPANTFLNSHLADARRRKLDLLRRAANITSTSGD